MRKRKTLADIGPNTNRIMAVRDGIRGVRRALDRKSCPDAKFLLKLTEKELKKLPAIGKLEAENLAYEKTRLKKACKV